MAASQLSVEVRVEFRVFERLDWRQRLRSLRPWRRWGWVTCEEEDVIARLTRIGCPLTQPALGHSAPRLPPQAPVRPP